MQGARDKWPDMRLGDLITAAIELDLQHEELLSAAANMLGLPTTRRADRSPPPPVQVPPRERRRKAPPERHLSIEPGPEDAGEPPAGHGNPVILRQTQPGRTAPQPQEWLQEAPPLQAASDEHYRPIPPDPLFEDGWSSVLALAPHFSTELPDARIDVEACVRRLAEFRLTVPLPRLKRRTLHRGLVLMEDWGVGMQPYHLDLLSLRKQIGAAVGKHRFAHFIFSGDPSQGFWQSEAEETPFHWPPPGTPICVVSDLGLRADAHIRRSWLRFLEQAAQNRSPVTVLSPYHRSRLADPLDRCPQVAFLHWTDGLPARPSAAPKTAPVPSGESCNLARLASLAMQIEPWLLRRLRRKLMSSGPEVEADFWFSPVTRLRASRFVDMLPRDQERLRQLLAQSGDLKAAWEIQRDPIRWERTLPAFQIEEAAAYAALAGLGDEKVAEALAPAVAALLNDDRPSLAEWARQAANKLPARARSSEAGRTMATLASLRTHTRLPADAAEEAGNWPSLLKKLPPRPVFVEVLAPGKMRISLEGDGKPSFTAPDTVPVVLKVRQGRKGARARETTYELAQSQKSFVIRVTGTLDITTLDGAVYSLDRTSRTVTLAHGPADWELAIRIKNHLQGNGLAVELQEGKRLRSLSGLPRGSGTLKLRAMVVSKQWFPDKIPPDVLLIHRAIPEFEWTVRELRNPTIDVAIMPSGLARVSAYLAGEMEQPPAPLLNLPKGMPAPALERWVKQAIKEFTPGYFSVAADAAAGRLLALSLLQDRRFTVNYPDGIVWLPRGGDETRFRRQLEIDDLHEQILPVEANMPWMKSTNQVPWPRLPRVLTVVEDFDEFPFKAPFGDVLAIGVRGASFRLPPTQIQILFHDRGSEAMARRVAEQLSADSLVTVGGGPEDAPEAHIMALVAREDAEHDRYRKFIEGKVSEGRQVTLIWAGHDVADRPREWNFAPVRAIGELYRHNRQLRTVGQLRAEISLLCQALGDTHPETLAAMDSLVTHRLERGAKKLAIKTLENLVLLRSRSLGPTHPETIATSRKLAELHFAASNLSRARDLYKRIVADLVRTHGPSAPETVTAKEELAKALYANGEFSSCAVLAQEVEAALGRRQGMHHPATLEATLLLADALYALGDFAAALARNESVVAGRTNAFGPDHPATREALARLDRTREQYDRHIKATQAAQRRPAHLPHAPQTRRYRVFVASMSDERTFIAKLRMPSGPIDFDWAAPRPDELAERIASQIRAADAVAILADGGPIEGAALDEIKFAQRIGKPVIAIDQPLSGMIAPRGLPPEIPLVSMEGIADLLDTFPLARTAPPSTIPPEYSLLEEEMKIYDTFISHAWSYSDEYNRLVMLLNAAPRFTWRNYSVPEEKAFDRMPRNQLIAKLDGQIRPVNVALIIAGMYTNHSDWIQAEIDIAKAYRKPIIGLVPWGAQRTPLAVQEAAVTMVGWNTDSIVDAIRRYAL